MMGWCPFDGEECRHDGYCRDCQYNPCCDCQEFNCLFCGVNKAIHEVGEAGNRRAEQDKEKS